MTVPADLIRFYLSPPLFLAEHRFLDVEGPAGTSRRQVCLVACTLSMPTRALKATGGKTTSGKATTNSTIAGKKRSRGRLKVF